MPVEKLKAKDFVSDQEVKWCPGCGDYSILKQMQTVLPEVGIEKKDVVFISGIGCSSRFPYYMNTYGMHSIHGRAPSVATGTKLANPDLHVWVITGDGDALSIGGNHFIHAFRRNLDFNVLLFNNEIYGLTKGQFSPTSEVGLKTKSSPTGTVDHPFNPVALALGADASFVARSMERDPKHMRAMMLRSAQHKGATFLEVYQNCPIFNDGIFEAFTDKKQRMHTAILVEQGQPLLFEKGKKGIRLDGLVPEIVDMEASGISPEDLWIHDEQDATKAALLSRFFEVPSATSFPRPFGVLYAKERPTYEASFYARMQAVKQKKGHISLNSLLAGNNTWKVTTNKKM